MTANSTLNLVSLDFDTLNSNFTNFLSINTIYKDAAFVGSNLSVLNDILAYNTFLNSFYLNMISTEMWNDSAQKLDSVVSHAKELNYVPNSYKSSSANLNFSLYTVGISSPLTIPKGAYFSGQNSNGTFGFTTDRSYSYTSSNSTFEINNLAVYQGTYTSDVFIIDNTQDSQKFVLSNPKIDTDSLSIVVTENNVNTVFNIATNLYNLNSNSNVFFIQGSQNGQYEILFGDNLFGRYPINGALVTADYRTTVGSDANGTKRFSLYTSIGNYNNGTTTNSTINPSTPSVGGSNSQSIESIRFYSPRHFAAQERAVSADDFSSLIISNFSGQIADVAPYGGELLTPPKYGTTVVCLKPTSGTIVPNYVKNNILNFFTNLNKLPYNLVITDPDYFYVSVISTVEYVGTETTLSSTDIESEVLQAMLAFFQTNVESFNSNFRYSKFVAAIDNADSSIESNDTQVSMIKRIAPLPNVSTSYIINYNNQAYTTSYPYTLVNLPPAESKPTFYSSMFTYVNNNISYPNSILRDDSYGNLVIFNQVNNIVSEINKNVGTINYQTGQVQINNLLVSNFVGNYISLYFVLESNDIIVSQNQIIEIDPNDVVINPVEI